MIAGLEIVATPAITLLYACILAIWIIALAARVILLRHADKVGIGAGESRRLERAIRVHANALETIPLILLLMLLLELHGVAAWFLHACGITLLLGRALHDFGLSRRSGTSFGRFTGMALTLLVTAALALAGLIRLFV